MEHSLQVVLVAVIQMDRRRQTNDEHGPYTVPWNVCTHAHPSLRLKVSGKPDRTAFEVLYGAAEVVGGLPYRAGRDIDAPVFPNPVLFRLMTQPRRRYCVSRPEQHEDQAPHRTSHALPRLFGGLSPENVERSSV